MGTIFDLAGFGGALAVSIISILMVCYGLTIRWIVKGYRGKE
jgi:hypothetical protein